tara:strand:- start:401 stop:1261 length:861 start_codon:yes stop_codon:yes gene_type:complete
MENSRNRFEFALIGDPVHQSISPILHNEVFSQLGINGIYKKYLISKNDFKKKIHQGYFNYLNGFNVTIPHKTSIMDGLDVINPRALEIGAVNCVVKKNKNLWGFNTDWLGFINSLIKNGIDPKLKTAFIIGAGGVSYAVVFALLNSNVSKIVIKNRSESKVELLIKNFSSKFKNIELINYNNNIHNIKDFDMIINCTSVGMYPNIKLSPINSDLFHSNHIVIDTIYNPIETKFLKDAKIKKAKILNGLDMFIYQALASLDIWLGESLTKNIDYETLKTKLIKKYVN